MKKETFAIYLTLFGTASSASSTTTSFSFPPSLIISSNKQQQQAFHSFHCKRRKRCRSNNSINKTRRIISSFSSSFLVCFVVPPRRRKSNDNYSQGIYQKSAIILNNNANEPSSAPPSSITIDKQNYCANDKNHNNDAFTNLARYVYTCLYQSIQKRDALSSGDSFSSPKGVTNWIDDNSALALQNYLGGILVREKGKDVDDIQTWIRWMKMTPSPMIVELSNELRHAVKKIMISSQFSKKEIHMNENEEELLSRMGCRLILFSSGSKLSHPLETPSGGVTYGTLLYGGIKRYRLLSGSYNRRPPRRVGEKIEIMTSSSPGAKNDKKAWVQFGGPLRMYEAVDMGPACILEVSILPSQTFMPPLVVENDDGFDEQKMGEENSFDMVSLQFGWNANFMFTHYEERQLGGSASQGQKAQHEKVDVENKVENTLPATGLYGKDQNDAFRSGFQSTLGGLDDEIEAIVRRVLDGRIIRPPKSDEGDSTTSQWNNISQTNSTMVALEAKELATLGLSPVRGLLLYGPPGCGKTALAREISKILHARDPKIVSAPELLDRWVGGSEKLVRSLFADAEAELAACGGDATKSALHVIVIDEIDAVFRRRSSLSDGGEVTRASAVNQILAKLDGIDAIPNCLVIGMTNRRELLDEALLRPGRLEVQVEIPLPDQEGRRQIMKVHFNDLRQRGRLSKPLCQAIDGNKEADINGSMRNILIPYRKSVVDLASDELTGGFSGADIAGLVRCAGSIALSRSREQGNSVSELLITLEDVLCALKEVKIA